MERLTLRSKNGLAFFDNDGVLIRGANGAFRQKKDMTGQYIHDRFVALDKAIDRLANYEDTGLEPGEIETLLAERDAAMKYIPHNCHTCKWWKERAQGIMCCMLPEGSEFCCFDEADLWQWRGPTPSDRQQMES